MSIPAPHEPSHEPQASSQQDPATTGPRLSRRQAMGAAAGVAAAASLGVAPARRASAQESVTIVYKTHEHPPGVALNQALIAEFEAQNPGITVEYEAIPYESYEQALFTSFAGGEGWDVFWVGDWLMPQLLQNDILAPVDPAAFGVTTQDEFLALHEPGALDAYVKDGTAYSAGVSEYNTFSLLYNPDHFAEAGITPPSETEPATWEQLATWSEQLAKVEADGTRTRNALEWAFTANVWTPLIMEPMIRQLGGEIVNPDTGEPQLTSPEVVKTMAYFGQMAEAGSIDPAFFVDINEDFAQGRTSMIIAGVWALPAIRGINAEAKIGATPLPVFEGGTRTSTLYSWGWLVGNQSSPEVQQAAWTFLNFLTSQGKRWWDETGFIQPRVAGQVGVEDLAAYRMETEPLLRVFNDDFAVGKYMFRSTRFYEIATALLRVQSLVFEGEDAEQALQDAQDELSA